jgi:hypothetical protein
MQTTRPVLIKNHNDVYRFGTVTKKHFYKIYQLCPFVLKFKFHVLLMFIPTNDVKCLLLSLVITE